MSSDAGRRADAGEPRGGEPAPRERAPHARAPRERLLTLLLRLVSATWRLREEIPEDCREIVAGRERAVVAFWHGKMLPVWYRLRGASSGALVSRSRDGGLLADYLEHGLGYGRVIRGSSSKQGREALADLVSTLAERRCLITPDGPRGPARRGKPGALVAAARAGVPVMLAGWHCRRVVRLGSWDRMEIPYPFAKVYIRYCRFDVSEASERDGTAVITTTAEGGEPMWSASPAPQESEGTHASGDGPTSSARHVWIGEDLLARFDAELDRVNGLNDRPRELSAPAAKDDRS